MATETPRRRRDDPADRATPLLAPLARLDPSRELPDALTPLSFLPEHERRVPFAPLPKNGRRRRH